MSKRLLVIGLIVVVATALTGLWWTAFGQGEVKLPEIPGITVEDPKPNGCVDCHRKVSEERDYRLTRYIEKLAKEEEHPDVVAAINTIPNDCTMCHSESAAENMGTEPFATLLHKLHLVGGKENHFITHYQGKCTYCHALNMETGSGKLNLARLISNPFSIGKGEVVN